MAQTVVIMSLLSIVGLSLILFRHWLPSEKIWAKIITSRYSIHPRINLGTIHGRSNQLRDRAMSSALTTAIISGALGVILIIGVVVQLIE